MSARQSVKHHHTHEAQVQADIRTEQGEQPGPGMYEYLDLHHAFTLSDGGNALTTHGQQLTVATGVADRVA